MYLLTRWLLTQVARTKAGSSPLTRLILLCSILHLVFSITAVPVVKASISVPATGQDFDSKPDRSVGLRLGKGYEYPGRLQYLQENPTLCRPQTLSEEQAQDNHLEEVPSDSLNSGKQ